MSPTQQSPLQGRRILLVEDELLVAMLSEQVLADAGCIVLGPAATVGEAIRLLEREPCDGAILDMNLRGEMSTPVAQALRDRAIPFVVVTGYEKFSLGDGFDGVRCVIKPVEPRELMAALADAFRAPRH